MKDHILGFYLKSSKGLYRPEFDLGVRIDSHVMTPGSSLVMKIILIGHCPGPRKLVNNILIIT